MINPIDYIDDLLAEIRSRFATGDHVGLAAQANALLQTRRLYVHGSQVFNLFVDADKKVLDRTSFEVDGPAGPANPDDSLGPQAAPPADHSLPAVAHNVPSNTSEPVLDQFALAIEVFETAASRLSDPALELALSVARDAWRLLEGQTAKLADLSAGMKAMGRSIQDLAPLFDGVSSKSSSSSLGLGQSTTGFDEEAGTARRGDPAYDLYAVDQVVEIRKAVVGVQREIEETLRWLNRYIKWVGSRP